MSKQPMASRSDLEALPADLADLASQLDALGVAARAEAPAGFEDRLLASVTAAAKREVEPIAASLPFPVARSGSAVQWRIAASIALSVATLGGLTWIASRTPTSPTTAVELAGAQEAQALAQELEQFVESAESWDLGVTDSIASAREAIDLASDAEDFWSDDTSDGLQLEDSL